MPRTRVSEDGEARMVCATESISCARCWTPETRATEDSVRYWRRKVTSSFMWGAGRTWTETNQVRGGRWGKGVSLHMKPLEQQFSVLWGLHAKY